MYPVTSYWWFAMTFNQPCCSESSLCIFSLHCACPDASDRTHMPWRSTLNTLVYMTAIWSALFMLLSQMYTACQDSSGIFACYNCNIFYANRPWSCLHRLMPYCFCLRRKVWLPASCVHVRQFGSTIQNDANVAAKRGQNRSAEQCAWVVPEK